MSALCDIAKNELLFSGFLRECESTNSTLIPDDIQSLVADFSRPTYLRYITSMQNSKDEIKIELDENIPDALSASIPDDVQHLKYKLDVICVQLGIQPSLITKISERNGGITLVSCGVSRNKNIFFYTKNNKLYRISKSVRKIPIDFITSNNDKIIDIKNGAEHTIFLTESGKVYSFGANSSGQCGLGKSVPNVSRLTLIEFVNNDKIISIECGKLHTLFINNKNELLVCGYNYSGQLGIKNDFTLSMSNEWASDSDSDSDDENSFSETDDDDTDFEWMRSGKGLEIFTPTINPFFETLKGKIKKIKCGLFHSIIITTKGECYIFGNKVYNEEDNVPYKLIMKKYYNAIIDISCTSKHDLILLYS